MTRHRSEARHDVESRLARHLNRSSTMSDKLNTPSMLTRRALLKSAALTAGTLIRVDDSQEAVASRIGVDKVLASVGGPIVEMNTI